MEPQRQHFEVGQQVDEDVTLGHPMRHGSAWSDWAAMSRVHGPARVRFLEVDGGAPENVVTETTAPFRRFLAGRARAIGAGLVGRFAWIAYTAPAGPSLTRLAAAVEGERVMLSERHARDLCARAARFLDALAAGPPNGLLTLEDLHIERDGSLLHYGAGTVALSIALGAPADWRQMVWAAPEAASASFVPSREADSYSLALALAAVLGGRISSRDAIPAVLQRVGERHGADVARVLRTMTQTRPELRIVDGASLLAVLGRRPEPRPPALSQPEQTSPPTSLRLDAPTPPSTGEVARWRDHEPTPSIAPDVVAAMMTGELMGDSVAALEDPTDTHVRIDTPDSSDYVTLDDRDEPPCASPTHPMQAGRTSPGRDERVWLLLEGSSELGPLSIAELAAMYRKGVLLPSRRVAHVSDRQFASLSRMPFFAALDESQAPAPILDREWMECSHACMPRDLCGLLRLLETAENARSACHLEISCAAGKARVRIDMREGRLGLPRGPRGRALIDARARHELRAANVPDVAIAALTSDDPGESTAALASLLESRTAMYALERLCVRMIVRGFQYIARGGHPALSRGTAPEEPEALPFATVRVLARAVQMQSRVEPGRLDECLGKFVIPPRWACLVKRGAESDSLLRIADVLGAEEGTIGQLRTIVRAASMDEAIASKVSDDHVRGVVRVADELVWLTWYERDAIVVAAWPGLYLSVVAGTLARLGAMA